MFDIFYCQGLCKRAKRYIFCELQQVAKIVETITSKLKQSTLKGREGKGSGKGLNSRYGGYWKLEKVFLLVDISTSFGEVLYANVSLLRNRKFDLISLSGWKITTRLRKL